MEKGTHNVRTFLRSDSSTGDPWGNRTPVSAVRGRCLSRLTNGPHTSMKKYSISF